MMRQDGPFVRISTANEDTFIHIRQFVYSDYDEGSPPMEIKMTLMQFRSLMFHLRALDSQFTQRIENAVEDEKCYDNNVNQMKSAGTKRSWDESEGNTAAANLQQVDSGTKNVVDEVAEQAWGELSNFFTSITSSDEMTNDVASNPVESEPAMDEPIYIPTPIDQTVPEEISHQAYPASVLTEAQVLDELVIIFAEELNSSLLENVVKSTCYGCVHNIDKNTNLQQHDVCALPRKTRINRYCKEALLLTDEVDVYKKLGERLLSRNVTLLEEQIVDLRTLIKNNKWMSKLKKCVFNM